MRQVASRLPITYIAGTNLTKNGLAMVITLAKYLTKPRLDRHELRKAIKALKHHDLLNADIDALKKRLAPILHHYVHPSPLIQPGERIFRAVAWPEKPVDKAQLGYPPPEKVKFGRCNRPSEPVFYGSVGSTAAIQELAPTHGTRLVISMWRVTKPILVASLGYYENVFDGSQRWSQVWWRRSNPRQMEPIGANTPENSYIDAFLANEFTRQVSKGHEWQYKLSVAISESYLKAKAAHLTDNAVPGVTRPSETMTGI